MSDFENEDIDKMFEEIISSDQLDEIKSQNIDAIISVERVSEDTLLKELLFISQSLSRAISHVNDLSISLMSIENYSLDEELKEMLGNIYKLSEDLDDYMIELVIEEIEENSCDEEEDE